MISYIRGELAAVENDQVVVDVGGVGFGIFMPGRAMGMLPPVGGEVKLYTYMNVREDAIQLFGFLTGDDLEVFRLLIGVSGIGPKGGLNILSCLSPDELRLAVMAHDVKAILKAPGIGRKTAEKLIIELQDKLRVEKALETESVRDADSGMQMEIVQALVSLGYDHASSVRAVRKACADKEMTEEEALKQALKYML